MLQSFVDLYVNNKEVQVSLLVALMKCTCVKAKGHKNPAFLAVVMNLFIALKNTSRTGFDFVSANFLGPALSSIQCNNAKSILCNEIYVEEKLTAAIEKIATN